MFRHSGVLLFPEKFFKIVCLGIQVGITSTSVFTEVLSLKGSIVRLSNPIIVDLVEIKYTRYLLVNSVSKQNFPEVKLLRLEVKLAPDETRGTRPLFPSHLTNGLLQTAGVVPVQGPHVQPERRLPPLYPVHSLVHKVPGSYQTKNCFIL